MPAAFPCPLTAVPLSLCVQVVACNPSHRQLVVHFPHLDKTGDSLRTYNSVEFSQFELAYAITVHKAQGGEAQHVVLALSPQHGRMLTRRLLYTGALLCAGVPPGACLGRGVLSVLMWAILKGRMHPQAVVPCARLPAYLPACLPLQA